jgi:hypothetical protein
MDSFVETSYVPVVREKVMATRRVDCAVRL